jgi:hypothetical protein
MAVAYPAVTAVAAVEVLAHLLLCAVKRLFYAIGMDRLGGIALVTSLAKKGKPVCSVFFRHCAFGSKLRLLHAISRLSFILIKGYSTILICFNY